MRSLEAKLTEEKSKIEGSAQFCAVSNATPFRLLAKKNYFRGISHGYYMVFEWFYNFCWIGRQNPVKYSTVLAEGSNAQLRFVYVVITYCGYGTYGRRGKCYFPKLFVLRYEDLVV